ncbi:MAG: hypothetical protein AB7O39_08575 [Flavobacteriaceae bacterium]
MIRALVYFLGFWLLAGAFIGAVADGARSIAAGTLLLMPAGEVWTWVSPGSLEATRAAFQAQGLSFLWDPILSGLLEVPASLLGIAIGALLMWAGRRRKPPETIGELDLR